MTSKFESDVQWVRHNFRSLIGRKFRPRSLGLINFYTVIHGNNRTDTVTKSIIFAEVKGCFEEKLPVFKNRSFVVRPGSSRSAYELELSSSRLWSQVRWTTGQERSFNFPTAAGFVCGNVSVTSAMFRDMIQDTPCSNLQSGFSRSETRVKY
jgi:hypothetical protein